MSNRGNHTSPMMEKHLEGAGKVTLWLIESEAQVEFQSQHPCQEAHNFQQFQLQWMWHIWPSQSPVLTHILMHRHTRRCRRWEILMITGKPSGKTGMLNM